MSLGSIHYNPEVFYSIIKTETLTNHNVATVGVKMDEKEEIYVFDVEVIFTEKDALLSQAKKLQESIVKTVKDMTGLTNVRVNILIKGLKIDK